ncbi:MAG: hypothetical protein J3Q66DRAFT_157237 [Benniella sp.]|nr:MAG: hypothetical protein J3Q66DRAFT_157237 [Benniella sp.]
MDHVCVELSPFSCISSNGTELWSTYHGLIYEKVEGNIPPPRIKHENSYTSTIYMDAWMRSQRDIISIISCICISSRLISLAFENPWCYTLDKSDPSLRPPARPSRHLLLHDTIVLSNLGFFVPLALPFPSRSLFFWLFGSQVALLALRFPSASSLFCLCTSPNYSVLLLQPHGTSHGTWSGPPLQPTTSAQSEDTHLPFGRTDHDLGKKSQAHHDECDPWNEGMVVYEPQGAFRFQGSRNIHCQG